MESFALVIGEALVDVVVGADGRHTERPGGSGANVAVALARLGRPVRFATGFADDERGRVLAQHLADAGVVLANDPHALERTSSAQATIDADGSATYEFDFDWRLNPVPSQAPRFVHVCSLGAVVSPGAEQVIELLEQWRGSTMTSYDVNARAAVTGVGPDVLARVERVAALSDLVKASDEDLAALYPGHTVDEAAAHLLGLGPRAVAVTRGGAGATWWSAVGHVDVPARPAQVVDTIGAGDTFSAAVLDALWDDLDRDPAEVLEHAGRAAAVTVSRAGADPPYHHELG